LPATPIAEDIHTYNVELSQKIAPVSLKGTAQVDEKGVWRNDNKFNNSNQSTANIMRSMTAKQQVAEGDLSNIDDNQKPVDSSKNDYLTDPITVNKYAQKFFGSNSATPSLIGTTNGFFGASNNKKGAVGMVGVGGFIDYQKEYFNDIRNWSSASIDALNDQLKDFSKGFKEAIPDHLSAASKAVKIPVDSMSAETGFDQGLNIAKMENSIADEFSSVSRFLSRFGVFIKSGGIVLDAYSKYQTVKGVPAEQQPAEAFVQGAGFTGEQIAGTALTFVTAPLELPFLVGAGAALLTGGIAGYAFETGAEYLEERNDWFKPK